MQTGCSDPDPVAGGEDELESSSSDSTGGVASQPTGSTAAPDSLDASTSIPGTTDFEPDGTTSGTSIGDGSGEGPQTEDPTGEGPFECDPELASEHLSLRRLSRVQYERSVHDVLRWAIGAEGDTIFAELVPLLRRMPADTRVGHLGGPHGGFSRGDQNIHQEHIQASYYVALAIGQRLTGEHLETVAGRCAVDLDQTNDSACLDAFIGRFGERALRRPLRPDELTFYRDVAGTGSIGAEGLADVIAVLLTAPQFLYLVEHGAGEIESSPGTRALGSWELAQRLSYQFWQAPPDDVLREAARRGELETEEGYAAAVDHVFDDPRTRETIAELFREWLWLDDLPPMDARVGTPMFDAFAGNLEVTPETTQNMANEVLAMTEYYTFAVEGTLDDMLLSNRSFATTADLSAIYGVQPWTGGEPPPFPNPERAGLIARAAFLATGSTNTRPIMKGVFIRKALLCDPIPPPPDNANASMLEVSEHATTREVVEGLTEQPGTTCAGCHATIINPLGFATEGFDALGRHRSAQVLYDAQGNVTAVRDIDSTAVPRVNATDTTEVTQAAELSTLLTESGRVHACFARNYVQWTFGREDDVVRDGCVLAPLAGSLLEGRPIVDALREIAFSDAFKTRTIED